MKRFFSFKVGIPIWAVGRLLALLMVSYFAARIFFWAVNFESFRSDSAANLVTAFLWGARFDLSFLLLWNLPFLLLALVPRSRIWRGEVWLMLLLNLPPLWWNLADAEYYAFQGRRSTWGLLKLWPDLRDQALQLSAHFWQVPLACVGFSFILGLGFLLSAQGVRPLTFKRWQGLAALPAFVVLVILGIRGGLETKPLGTWHAMRLPSTELGALALNTPFHVIKVDPSQAVTPSRDFPTLEAAREAAGGTFASGSRFPPNKSNVVVIILESFALEHIEAGYTPFLQRLAKQSLFFENNFANTRQSIDAVAAVLGGIPAMMVEPYVTSPYNGNAIVGLGGRLARKGYETYFFHGGRNGSMYIDVMSRLAGFERYFGLSEYPDRRDSDGVWGIFDEPFLQFTAQKLGSAREPFAAGVFTLSSHNPYTVPQKYAGRFRKGPTGLHESLGYADFALERFFDTASRMPWYRNTLFVLTADHTAELQTERFRTQTGVYRVPLIFFHPDGRLPIGTSPRVTQHVDVLPSVLDALGEDLSRQNPSLLPFGRSVFDSEKPGRAVNKSGGQYWIVEGDSLAGLPEEGGVVTLQRLSPDLLAPREGGFPVETRSGLERALRGYVQFYRNGLAENSWFTR